MLALPHLFAILAVACLAKTTSAQGSAWSSGVPRPARNRTCYMFDVSGGSGICSQSSVETYQKACAKKEGQVTCPSSDDICHMGTLIQNVPSNATLKFYTFLKGCTSHFRNNMPINQVQASKTPKCDNSLRGSGPNSGEFCHQSCITDLCNSGTPPLPERSSNSAAGQVKPLSEHFAIALLSLAYLLLVSSSLAVF